MKVTMQEGKTFPLIPEGEVVNVEVKDVREELKPFKDKDGKPVKKMVFEFLVTDEQYAGRRLWGDAGLALTNHPDCKLRLWTQELLGMDSLPNGYDLETDDLIGLPARIEIGHRLKKDGTFKEVVAEVIRPRPAKSLTAHVARTVITQDEDDEEEPF